MRRILITLSLASVLTVAITAQRPAQPPPPQPSREPSPRPVSPPAMQPERLLQAHALALAAYPELARRGVQTRVEETAARTVITFGEAQPDRDDLMALSRPRAAQLVIEAAFDGANQLQRATLRGLLAHVPERRRIRALDGGWAAALDAGGARFGPARQAALLDQLDLRAVRRLFGSMRVENARFEAGAGDDALYWDVTALDPGGEVVHLGFEPFGGRLVKVQRGGVR